jgi:hypothetical protein
MRPAPLRPLALVPAVLALAACGSESSSGSSGSEEREAAASPAVALREAGATRTAIEDALATYKSGDAAAAEDQVAEAYVRHFEKVEDPLKAKDEELNERLEETISGDLREQMKAEAPAAQIEQTVQGVVDDLGTAEGLLR